MKLCGCCGKNPKTSDDISFSENVPKKRNACTWWISFVLCLMTASGIVAYGFIHKTTVEYDVADTNNMDKMRNITSCYQRKEKNTYYVLLNLGLGLVGMVFSNFVGRLCLVFGECRYWSRRYNSTKTMFKACFSGTSWSAVSACLVLVLITIAVPLSQDSSFELEYMLYVLSGIGAGPLIIHLLNLNTQSDVDISTIIEEKETSVGTTLAWSYYVCYLKRVLPAFGSTFTRSGLNKLILFISHDCHTVDDLGQMDDKIHKLGQDMVIDEFKLPVYRLETDTKRFEFVAHFVKEPLVTMATMTEKSKAIKNNEEREYEVKMLYKKLSEILENPDDTQCKEKCILVTIKVNSLNDLKNGKLAKLIENIATPSDSNLSNPRIGHASNYSDRSATTPLMEQDGMMESDDNLSVRVDIHNGRQTSDDSSQMQTPKQNEIINIHNLDEELEK